MGAPFTAPTRRNSPRASVSIPIQLSPKGDAVPATLINLSSSGLCCRFPDYVSEMTLVGMALELPGLARPAMVRGAVVRCEKLRGMNPPTYELGVFFTDMSDDTRKAIGRFAPLRSDRFRVKSRFYPPPAAHHRTCVGTRRVTNNRREGTLHEDRSARGKPAGRDTRCRHPGDRQEAGRCQAPGRAAGRRRHGRQLRR